jgi:hypothetical protein
LRTCAEQNKGDEVTGDWRELHSEELHNLYSLPNTIRMIKSRIMRWVGHVAYIGEVRNMYKFWLQSLKARDNSVQMRG